MSCALLLGGGLEWYLCYRAAGVRVSLDQKVIVYRNRGGMKRIPFDSISRFVFPLGYIGGWTKIMSKEHALRLTATLEHLADFLLELRAALDERGLSDCYDRKEFFSFMKTAVHVDQPSQKLYSVFWMFILASAASLALGIGYAGMVGWNAPGTALWASLSWLWPIAIYLVAEIPFALRVAKGADEQAFTFPPRDVGYEKTVYLRAVLLGEFAYVSAFAALLAFGRASW